MRKFKWFFAIWSLVGGMHAAALACETRYDPATKVAVIPCVGIQGGTQVFGVVLEWTGGNNFALTSSEEHGVVNPDMSRGSLKILITPVPVAIIFGHYLGCARTLYGRPSFVQTSNHIDIRLKTLLSLQVDIGCSADIVPFAEIVRLPDSASSQTYTYSVNGESITPSY